jgi:hypothetical protein
MTAVGHVQASPLASSLTTPQILKIGVIAICLANLLMMGAAIAGARSHRHAMQAIGKDSAPSIIAAEHIRAALADMDADAANELLQRGGSLDAFEGRQNEATTAIVTAAENITYGDFERQPIQRLAVGVGSYTAGVQRARDRLEAGDKTYLLAWRKAAAFMDARLLPAATDLDTVNRNELDKAYAGQRTASARALVLLLAGAVITGGVLIAMQIFVAGRMRRILNPGLAAATLATVVFLIYAGQRFAANDRDLKVAKEDAFESIHALWQARAVAYAANSDESRYLLDPSQAAKYESDFQAKAAQVDVFLANEMKNITFAGEEEAAREAVAEFAAYRKVDRQIRDLEKSGKHDAAIALCTGSAAGQSDYVFKSFDDALGKTLMVNQEAFDAAVERGFVDVAGFEIAAPAAAFLIALLGWVGLRPRLREYSV